MKKIKLLLLNELKGMEWMRVSLPKIHLDLQARFSSFERMPPPPHSFILIIAGEEDITSIQNSYTLIRAQEQEIIEWTSGNIGMIRPPEITCLLFILPIEVMHEITSHDTQAVVFIVS